MNLYVGNLSPETTEADLRTIFSEFGEVVAVKILLDTATGLPRGFGFVEMADKFQGFDAITNIDMTYFQGNIINVRESKPKGQQGGGGGSYGNNRGGGNRGGGGFNRDRNRTAAAATITANATTTATVAVVAVTTANATTTTTPRKTTTTTIITQATRSITPTTT